MSIVDEIVMRASRKHYNTGIDSDANTGMSRRYWAEWLLEGMDDYGQIRTVSIYTAATELPALLIGYGPPDLSGLRKAKAGFYLPSRSIPGPLLFAEAVTNCPTHERFVEDSLKCLEGMFLAGTRLGGHCVYRS